MRHYLELTPLQADTTVWLQSQAGLSTGSRAMEVSGSLLIRSKRNRQNPHPGWGMRWGSQQQYSVMLYVSSYPDDDIAIQTSIDVIVENLLTGKRIKRSIKGKEGGNVLTSTLRVEIEADSLARVYAGIDRMVLVGELPMDEHPGDFWGLQTTTRLNPLYAVEEYAEDAASMLKTQWTPELLCRYFAENAPNSVEGVWKYLDRKNNPDLGRPGGRYYLATVANDNGGWDIIYIAGAESNPSLWQPGMKKGELRPTVFADNYDLVWYDAMSAPINEDASAGIAAGGLILECNFPLYETMLRFSRIPAAEAPAAIEAALRR